MELRINILENTYSICIGRETSWFKQVYFITIARLWFDKNLEVSYAELVFKV